MNFTYMAAPKVVCLAGGIAQLGTLMGGLGARRVLIVSDPGVVSCGFAAQAAESLREAGIEAEVFDKVAADPPVAGVEAAVAAARSFRADGIAGLGGGSSLDTAKVVALAAASGQPIDEMIGVERATGRRLPLIQIPSTAGTGSETTWVSVLTSATNEKKAIYAPQLLPDIALLDAGLTLGMPRRITAATALDEEIERLAHSSGLETRLSQLGVTEAEIPAMAQEVTTGISRLLANNPVDMTSGDVAALYREVL
jgi:alcohol dehydrogenase class IV